MELIERARRALQNYPPHVREREAAKLIEALIERVESLEMPKNLEAYYQDGSGPVVLVVQPERGVSGQSSLVEIVTKPYAMLFGSREDAAVYFTANAEKWKRCKTVACYPVFEVLQDKT